MERQAILDAIKAAESLQELAAINLNFGDHIGEPFNDDGEPITLEEFKQLASELNAKLDAALGEGAETAEPAADEPAEAADGEAAAADAAEAADDADATDADTTDAADADAADADADTDTADAAEEAPAPKRKRTTK